MQSTLTLNYRMICSWRHFKLERGFGQRYWFFAICDKLDALIENWENVYMANKKGKNNSKADWMVDFASVKLRAEDKDAFAAWVQEIQKHEVDPLLEVLAAGWKVSHSLDADNDCFIVSLTQKNENDRNAGICVVSRSDNPYEALAMGFYKINVMHKGKRLPTEDTGDNWG